MFWEVIELNSAIRGSDVTKSRFSGTIIDYSERDEMEGKGT